MTVLRAQVPGVAPGFYKLGEVMARVNFLLDCPQQTFKPIRVKKAVVKKLICNTKKAAGRSGRPALPKALIKSKHVSAREYRQRNLKKCRKKEAVWRNNNRDKMNRYQANYKLRIKAYEAFRKLFGTEAEA